MINFSKAAGYLAVAVTAAIAASTLTGCGGTGHPVVAPTESKPAPIVAPKNAGDKPNDGCPANYVAIPLTSESAVIDFTVANAGLLNEGTTLVGGLINHKERLIRTEGTISNIKVGQPHLGPSSNSMMTPDTPPFDTDGSMIFTPSKTSDEKVSGKGQIVVKGWRIKNFYDFLKGKKSNSSQDGLHFPFGVNPYSGQPFFGDSEGDSTDIFGDDAGNEPAQDSKANKKDLFCLREVGFALSVTIDPAVYTHSGQAYKVGRNSLYNGKAFLTGLYQGQVHGFAVQW